MPAFTIALILKSLDVIHDLLHPFFKDEPDSQDLKKVLEKLEEIEKEIKDVRKE